jgi:hypothetical protein
MPLVAGEIGFVMYFRYCRFRAGSARKDVVSGELADASWRSRLVVSCKGRIVRTHRQDRGGESEAHAEKGSAVRAHDAARHFLLVTGRVGLPSCSSILLSGGA